MYAVLDFETNGLDPNEKQIIEIACIKLDADMNPIDNYHTMVSLSEGQILPQFIRQLTGITAEDLKDGLREDFALKQIKDFIGDSIVVAQFASFDLSFLAKVMMPEKFICTRSMARQLRPNHPASLWNLAEYYEVTNKDPHRAYADVAVTAEVLKHLRTECDSKGIEYINVMVDSTERPLKYIPHNATVKYMENFRNG